MLEIRKPTDEDDAMQLRVGLGEMSVCVLNHTACDDQECKDCDMSLSVFMDIEFEQAYATEQAFIFESTRGAHFSVVLPKNQTSDHEVQEAVLPETVTQRLANLGIKEPIGFFARTWSEEETRWHPEGRRFVELLASEHSNALIVFTLWEGTPLTVRRSITDTKHYCERIGALDYGFDNTSEEIDGADFGYEYWIFQYDPKTDQLQIPSDPAEDKIDTFLRRQETLVKLRAIVFKAEPLTVKARKMDQALRLLMRQCEINLVLETIPIMLNQIEAAPNNELCDVFNVLVALAIACHCQKNLLVEMCDARKNPSEQALFSLKDKIEAHQRDLQQELIEIKTSIAKDKLAGWSQDQLRAECERLGSKLASLTAKVQEYCDELGIEF